jgi:hypothetical protein
MAVRIPKRLQDLSGVPAPSGTLPTVLCRRSDGSYEWMTVSQLLGDIASATGAIAGQDYYIDISGSASGAVGQPAGLQVTGEIGTVTAAGVRNETALPSGLEATGELGTVDASVAGGVTATPSGLEVTGEIGTVTATGVRNETGTPSGLEATGEIGTVTADGGASAGNSFTADFTSGLSPFTTLAGTPGTAGGRLVLDGTESAVAATSMTRGFYVEFDLQMATPPNYSAYEVGVTVNSQASLVAGNRYTISFTSGEEDGAYFSFEILKDGVAIATGDLDNVTTEKRIRIEFHANTGPTPNDIILKVTDVAQLVTTGDNTDGTHTTFSHLLFHQAASQTTYFDDVLVGNL